MMPWRMALMAASMAAEDGLNVREQSLEGNQAKPLGLQSWRLYPLG